MSFSKYRLIFMLMVFAESLVGTAWAQMTVTVTSVPQLTPLLEELYIVGSFNNWEPGEPQYILTPTGQGHYSADIPGTNGETISFKITRGAWATVEGSAVGAYIPDRSTSFVQGGNYEIQVAGWEDLPGSHTVTPNVFILSTRFAIPQLERTRRIWVCLPDDYFTSVSHYPVWYMHDGQNLFSSATALFGEWQIDETLATLGPEACRSIVVGIDNGGQYRIDEYAPWLNSQYNAGGEGADYLGFVVNSLKPVIDQQFRTLTGREHTCTGGSSLGGLISLYMLLQRPDVFARAAVLSPAFWFNYDEMLTLSQNADLPADTRVYMVGGQTESASMVPHMNAVRDALITGGLAGNQVTVVADPSGVHNEGWWSLVFPQVYAALANCQIISEVKNEQAPVFRLYPNPVRDSLYLYGTPGAPAQVHIYDSTGKRVREIQVNRSSSPAMINCENLAPGLYYLHIVSIQEGGAPIVLPFIRQ